MSLVYHYAPWAYLPGMVQAQELRPSNAGAEGELPILWFSAHPHWEATAGKAVRSQTGSIKILTLRQQAQAVGAIRFGLHRDDARLLPWKAACLAAGTSRDARRQMERRGVRLGADPAHWFGMTTAMQLDELSLEVFLNDAWHPAVAEEMASAWQELERAAVGD